MNSSDIDFAYMNNEDVVIFTKKVTPIPEEFVLYHDEVFIMKIPTRSGILINLNFNLNQLILHTKNLTPDFCNTISGLLTVTTK